LRERKKTVRNKTRVRHGRLGHLNVNSGISHPNKTAYSMQDKTELYPWKKQKIDDDTGQKD